MFGTYTPAAELLKADKLRHSPAAHARGSSQHGVGARRGSCHIGIMAEPEAYRVIVRARGELGPGYTYLITRSDDPIWSQGTHIYYPSPEAAGEAGRVALESLLTRRAAK